jgi:polyisoprenoid-binding protein YceI
MMANTVRSAIFKTFNHKLKKPRVMSTVQSLNRIKWALDPSHSQIGFKVKHLMVTNVRGTFKDYKADILSTGEDFLNAEIDISIYPASIDTGDAMRNTHLTSPEFFDVEKFKVIDFKATRFVKNSNSEYTMHGNLTIKEVTKKIKLDVEFNGMVKDPWGVKRAAFVVTGKISRNDFGLTWNKALETGGLMVGDEVDIKCDIQLIQQSESKI